MFNVNDCIALIRDAETVYTSPYLENDERVTLLRQLHERLPEALYRFPHVPITAAAIARLLPAEARPTVGEQDATQVAPRGDGEATAEAGEGAAEGKPEQAQDAGGVADVGDSNSAPAETTAPAEKPKQGKARKQRA